MPETGPRRSERIGLRPTGRKRREAVAVAAGDSHDGWQCSMNAARIGQLHEQSACADGEELVRVPAVEIVAEIKRGDANAALERVYHRSEKKETVVETVAEHDDMIDVMAQTVTEGLPEKCQAWAGFVDHALPRCRAGAWVYGNAAPRRAVTARRPYFGEP
jgi:hypothetical protein